MRLKDKTANGFKYKMEEWAHLDDWHTGEDIAFLIAEEGSY